MLPLFPPDRKYSRLTVPVFLSFRPGGVAGAFVSSFLSSLSGSTDGEFRYQLCLLVVFFFLLERSPGPVLLCLAFLWLELQMEDLKKADMF